MNLLLPIEYDQLIGIRDGQRTAIRRYLVSSAAGLLAVSGRDGFEHARAAPGHGQGIPIVGLVLDAIRPHDLRVVPLAAIRVHEPGCEDHDIAIDCNQNPRCLEMVSLMTSRFLDVDYP